MHLIAFLDGCDGQGRRSPLPTPDYLCCDVTTSVCSDVMDRGGTTPRDTCIMIESCRRCAKFTSYIVQYRKMGEPIVMDLTNVCASGSCVISINNNSSKMCHDHSAAVEANLSELVDGEH